MSGSSSRPDNRDNKGQREPRRDDRGSGSSWTKTSNQGPRDRDGVINRRPGGERTSASSTTGNTWGRSDQQASRSKQPMQAPSLRGRSSAGSPASGPAPMEPTSPQAAPASPGPAGKSWAALLSPEKKKDVGQPHQPGNAPPSSASAHLKTLGAIRGKAPASTSSPVAAPAPAADSKVELPQPAQQPSPKATSSSPAGTPALQQQQQSPATKSWASLVSKKEQTAPVAPKPATTTPVTKPKPTAAPAAPLAQKEPSPIPAHGGEPEPASVPASIPAPVAPIPSPAPVLVAPPHPFAVPHPSHASPHGFAFQRGGGVVVHHPGPMPASVMMPPLPHMAGGPGIPMVPMHIPAHHYPGIYPQAPPMGVPMPVPAWGMPPPGVPVGHVPMMPVPTTPLPRGPAMPPMPGAMPHMAPPSGPTMPPAAAPLDVVMDQVENLGITEPAAVSSSPSDSAPAADVQSGDAPGKPATSAAADPAPVSAAPAGPMSWAARAKAVAAAAPVADHKPHPAQRLPGQHSPSPISTAAHPHHGHTNNPSGGGSNSRQQQGGRGRGRGNPAGQQHQHRDRRQGTHPTSPTAHKTTTTTGYNRTPKSPTSSHTSAAVEKGVPPIVASAVASTPAQSAPAPAVAPTEAPASSPIAAAPAKVAGNGHHWPKDVDSALAALCQSKDLWLHATDDVRVEPRGLNNPGHLCFMNSVLQALMGSNSFCKMLRTLQAAAPVLDGKQSPTLSALSELAAKFETTKSDGVQLEPKKKDSLNDGIDNLAKKANAAKNVAVLGGQPFMATMLMDIVQNFVTVYNPSSRNGGASIGDLEQQDAQEFLNFLVDGIQQELLTLQKTHQDRFSSDATDAADAAADHEEEEEEEDGWLTMSGKRTVKKQEVGTAPSEPETPATALFQGKLASSVACAGAPTSVTLQPFNVLGMHIHGDQIHSIADALDALTASEKIHDYKPMNSDTPTTATKTLRFMKLPHIMVMHLMRFEYSYSNLRSTKITKPVAFEPTMAIRSSWLAVGSKDRGAEYRLIATVSHHGKTSTSGHYTADVLQPDGRWLRFDDGNVILASQQVVLNDRPYLLFYQRLN